MISDLRFTVPELIIILGAAQCVYIIVYLLFRSGKLSRAGLPILFFLVLATFLSWTLFEEKIPEYFVGLSKWRTVLISFQVPLSMLLIVQICQIYKTPSIKQYSVLLIQALAYGSLFLYLMKMGNCEQSECVPYDHWYRLVGVLGNSLCFLSVWFNRNLIRGLLKEKAQKERYWLVLTMIFTNIAFVLTMLFSIGVDYQSDKLSGIEVGYVIFLVYLTGTSLFRIYPQAVLLNAAQKQSEGLGKEDLLIVERVKELLLMQKIYHEQGYGRVDLARECETSEANISRIINTVFGKSIPQLLNEKRVEDAILMLEQTDAPIKVIAQEVGFSSLPTFNRAFKEITGAPPSKYAG